MLEKRWGVDRVSSPSLYTFASFGKRSSIPHMDTYMDTNMQLRVRPLMTVRHCASHQDGISSPKPTSLGGEGTKGNKEEALRHVSQSHSGQV